MRRRLFARRAAESDESNPYWVSFTDLMTALLVVFMLAVVALVLQVTQAQASLDAQEEDLQQIREEADAEREAFSEQVQALSESEQIRGEAVIEAAASLQSQGIPATVSDNNSVLSIPTEVLGFDSASFEIDSAFEASALAIGQAVAESIRSEGRIEHLDTVFVEGHTDNRPFEGPNGMDNWGLSTFRAISLWNLWEDALPRDDQLATLTRADGSPLFSVSGYGDTRPVTESQNTDAERAANRRIEIRFTVVQPTADDLEGVLEGAAGS